MDIKKLDRWAELLLDTGKRNNLVNFKDTQTSTVEVLYPETADLFAKAESSAAFEVYNPLLMETEEDTPSEESPDEDATNKAPSPNSQKRKGNDSSVKWMPPRPVYLKEHAAKVRKYGQVLLYNAVHPIAALKNIHKRAASAIEETGVNVAYMVFGFIHWKDNNGTDAVYSAPLLLAPVLFENESTIEPYRIRMTEDDVIVNPTFNFKLRTEYNASLPTLGDETFDEYVTKVTDVASKLGWTVTKECKIGIFSFLKINMYQDLKENAEIIMTHPNVRLLLGDKPTSVPSEKTDLPSSAVGNLLLDLHNVVDADSSQLEAIRMAKEGQSFVLQGPPGTGKSQTITNILAECLSDGKKVLFVSEKLAALNVVYEKLKQAGLEEFCLELHSHKANKKEVIAELCRTIRKPPTRVKAEAMAEITAKMQSQEALDAYVSALHVTRPVVCKTLFQLLNSHAALSHVEDIDYVIPHVDTLDEAYLTELCALLDQYSAFVPTIGKDYRTHPWFGFSSKDLSRRTKLTIQQDIQNAAAALTALSEEAKILEQKCGISIPDLQTLRRYCDFLEFFSKSDVLTPALLSEAAVQDARNALASLIPLADEVIAFRRELNRDYSDDLYKLDGADLHKKLTRQYDRFFSRLFNGEYRKILQDINLCRTYGNRSSYTEAVHVTGLLKNYQNKLAQFNTLSPRLESVLGSAFVGVDSDWNTITADLDKLEQQLTTVKDLGILPTFSPITHKQSRNRMASIAQNASKILTESHATLETVAALFDPGFWNFHTTTLQEQIDKCTACPAAMDSLENWCRFYDLLRKLISRNALPFIHYLIEHGLSNRKVSDVYRRAYYCQYIDHVIYNEPILAKFTRITQDETVKTFAEKDEFQFSISQARIKASLSAERPALDILAAGSATATLLREGEKKRKQKSIRTLLSEIGDLAQVLKPCFLMSPLSVSTFLSASDIRFDVVVFDEASQIFPQDAIGAIYRGSQLIVVGDSRQMPPSNFFNTSVEPDDSDEERGDVTDFESILDICSTTFSQIRLKWHYRSRYEQLIAFSNQNFYENDLVTFPSVQTDRPWIGVDYHHVDGTFDRRTKTNRREAEYIVDLIYQNIDMFPDRSLGVVAFSVSQQDLIDKLLSKRRQTHPDKEAFFRSDRKEPFFIKNLETVQGDERDTIIFSVGYARDDEGKLLHNFGPLNQAGGERRLNVAVTRAKLNVQLVSSIHHTDIDLGRTKAEGSRLLKEYLNYAENGPMTLRPNTPDSEEEGYRTSFEDEVAQFLREQGYNVDAHVGCSAFRIDLGLRIPDSLDYALAIECDGDSYRDAKNARDRDRLRQEVLERMGWIYYRIWSTDWYKNNQIEKDRLLAVVTDALHSPGKFVLPDQEEVPPTFDVPAEVKHSAFPIYQEVNLMEAYTRCQRSYQAAVVKLLQSEAPLSEEWLIKRSVEIFHREKVTSVVVAEYREAMSGYQNRGIEILDGFLYLRDQTDYRLRIPAPDQPPREIKYISLEDLAAGMFEVICQNVSVDKNCLFHLIATKLGFARAGNAIQERLELALQKLADIVDLSDDILSMKNR